ncbi:MAG TPA: PIN domain-containing protein [Verrucomicrobiota bacterium]|nr:PIN domain-containing protein [Verrucomicrobiota bacterium]HNU50509.1 PIN domain-containing protein [Verrucomicrobiota bacterium]
MPAADVFLDSNVLLHALSDAPQERAKRDRAAAVIATANFGTSYQVLMETWVVATRQMARPVSPVKVAAFLEQILAFPCIAGTAGLYRQAVRLATRYRIHPYDAAILAAARELGARHVLSEDFNHGQTYDGVQVLNPFRSAD